MTNGWCWRMTGVIGLLGLPALAHSQPAEDVDEEAPAKVTPLPKIAPAKPAIDPALLREALERASPERLPHRGEKLGVPGVPRPRPEPSARRAEERRSAAKRARSVFSGRPPTPAYRQAVLRHARRVAEISRVLEVAEAERNAAAAGRARALLEKERARHAAWIQRYAEHLRRAGTVEEAGSARPDEEAER